MKNLNLLVAVILSFAVGSPAYAVTITTFTDEGTFKASLASFTTHTFDAFRGDPGNALGGEVLDQQISGIDFDNSIIAFGGFGGTSRSAPNVVLNNDLVNPIVFTFTTPVLAVGLFNTSLVDRERFSIFDAGNNLLASIDLPEAVVNFGGFISDVGIARVAVVPIAPTNGSIFIDDVTVGTPVGTPIPEPSTLLLLVSGLVGAMGFRRKRLLKRAC